MPVLQYYGKVQRIISEKTPKGIIIRTLIVQKLNDEELEAFTTFRSLEKLEIGDNVLIVYRRNLKYDACEIVVWDKLNQVSQNQCAQNGMMNNNNNNTNNKNKHIIDDNDDADQPAACIPAPTPEGTKKRRRTAASRGKVLQNPPNFNQAAGSMDLSELFGSI